MDIPKRVHTYKKAILRFADLDLRSYGMDKEFSSFMAYVDDIQAVDLDILTTGQWKKLYAALRSLADKTNVNYCIYQNKWNIYFDVTSNCIGTEDEISEDDGELVVRNTPSRESSLDKLKRYKYELEQIDMKIVHLEERRKEYIEKMEPIKIELATLLDDLSDPKYNERYNSNGQ